MTFIKGEALKDLTSLQERMNRIFSESLNRIKEFSETAEDKVWSPQVDIIELPGAYVLLAEIPGVPRESLSVEIQGDTLVITGERPLAPEMSEGSMYHSERHYGAFKRAFNLPVNVEASRIEAKVADGLLSVRIAKPDDKIKPVRVKIE